MRRSRILAAVALAAFAAPHGALAWQEAQAPAAEAGQDAQPNLPLSDIRIDIGDEELSATAAAAPRAT